MQVDLETLLREHGSLLSRIAASYEAEPRRREDLLQEIALALWRALPQWRGDASLRTFAARIAHNRAVDHLVRHSKLGEDAIDERHADTGADPQWHAEREQISERLLAAVRRLPLGQRQPVVLALEGFSQQEIGAALGIGENTVAQRLSRARKQLREWLGETA